MAKKTAQERNMLKELWMLLFEDPENLNDEQIVCLLEAEKQLRDVICRVYYWFPDETRRVQRYRTKKNELSQLATEELMEKRQGIINQRSSVLSSVPDEELSDSFFEAPSIDSDENILFEILTERGVIKS